MNDYMRGWSDGHREGVKIAMGLIIGLAISFLITLIFSEPCKATPRNAKADIRLIFDANYYDDTYDIETEFYRLKKDAGIRGKIVTDRQYILVQKPETNDANEWHRYMMEAQKLIRGNYKDWKSTFNIIFTGALSGRGFAGIANASLFSACTTGKQNEAVVFGQHFTYDGIPVDEVVGMAAVHETAHLLGAKHVRSESIMNVSAIGYMFKEFRAGNMSYRLGWDKASLREVKRCYFRKILKRK